MSRSSSAASSAQLLRPLHPRKSYYASSSMFRVSDDRKSKATWLSPHLHSHTEIVCPNTRMAFFLGIPRNVLSLPPNSTKLSMATFDSSRGLMVVSIGIATSFVLNSGAFSDLDYWNSRIVSDFIVQYVVGNAVCALSSGDGKMLNRFLSSRYSDLAESFLVFR